jgi:putative autotransporter adhesin-like protein
MKKYTWLLIAPLFVISACHNFGGRRVRGNGVIKTEDRTISSFKNLEVHGGIDVVLLQGELKPLQFKGDENLFQYIEVRQEGDNLIIGEKDDYNLDATDKLQVFITAPVYRSISLSGASSISSENKITGSEEMELNLSGAGDIRMEIDVPKLTAEISGVGSMYIKGQTKDVELGLSGAGSAHCFDLLSENTKVDVSGVGSAEVFGSVKIDAEVSGVGSVKYKGNATDVHQQVSGVGSVSKVN